MSLQLKKPVNKAKNLKFGLAAGAVILGTGYLVLNTFPHLKTSIWNYITGEKQQEREVKEEEIEEEQSNEPIELHESQVDLSASKLHDQSYVDIAEWSNDNLKSWLSQKEVNPPPNASHDNLVSLVKSIQENPT